MVCEERFTTSRWTEYKLVPVCDYATLHRQIRYIQMDRLSGQAVSHFDTERRGRIVVVGFFREEAQSRLNECVKTFLARKIACIARHSSPKQSGYVRSVVARLTLHQCQCTTAIVL